MWPRSSCLDAVLYHFHFDRATYGDVFGVARWAWSLLALCWTTDWNPDKSAGVAGVAVFFLLTRVIGALLDRAEAVERRARVADDLERLIDTANAPIFGIDTKGRVNEWNRSTAAISGYAKADVLGGRRLLLEFIAPENRDSVNRVLRRALAGNETANYECSLVTRGGERVSVLLNATTRRDAFGRVIGVIGVGQDITELRAKEREAKEREAAHQAQLAETRAEARAQVERDKAEARAQVERDATAYFFHEFRGDLNLVKGALAQVSGAQRTSLLESAVRSAEHMAKLVNRAFSQQRTTSSFLQFINIYNICEKVKQNKKLECNQCSQWNKCTKEEKS